MPSLTVSHVPKAFDVARRVLAWLGWAGLAGFAAYFLLTTLPNYFHFDAEHYRQYWPKRWWLITHVCGGTLALTMGLFQFSTTLRKRYVMAHRWMGRVYLIGVLVGSIGACYMGFFVSSIKAFGWSLEFLALAWVVTSAMAYVTVMRRQFAAHKDWMVRSYTVTFAFVLFRIGERNDLFSSLGPSTALTMLVWMSWAIPLLVVDVAQRWRQTIGATR